MERQKEMDVMLAIGILYVVLGHNYQPSIFPFPAYSFHIVLFFFVSGYFFVPKSGILEKLNWIKRKFVKLVASYYILNLIFMLVTLFLKTKGINLGDDPGWYSFFIKPIINGHQYALFIPAWFIIQLFIVHTIFQLGYFSNKKIYSVFILAILFALSLFMISKSYTNMYDFKQVVIRTTFASLFYAIGFVLSQYKSLLKKILVNPLSVIICIVIYSILGSYFGPTTYELTWAKFHSAHIFTPILSSLLCIILFYNFSCAFASLFSKNNFVYKIGQNTYAIMALHLSVFFVINYILYSFNFFDKSSLSNNVYFNFGAGNIWFIYSGLGILVPTLMSIGYKKLKNRLKLVTGKSLYSS